MNAEDRIKQIQQTLEAIHNGWPFFIAHVEDRLSSLTEALINNDNEQTRGAIKELRRIAEMPEALAQERDLLSTALAEQAAD